MGLSPFIVDYLRVLGLKSLTTTIEIMSSELAVVYSALILADAGLDVTADRLKTLVEAAKVNVDGYWYNLFAKALANRDINDIIAGAGSAAPASGGAAAPAAGGDAPAEEAAPAKKESSSSSSMGGGFDMFG